jgi:hypothetical protein
VVLQVVRTRYKRLLHPLIPGRYSLLSSWSHEEALELGPKGSERTCLGYLASVNPLAMVMV